MTDSIDTPESLAISQVRGCSTIVLIIFLGLWIFVLSGISLFLRWSIEQTMFETDQGVMDGRWVVHLVTSILLLLALVPAFFLSQNQRIKLALKTWVIAGVFSLLSVPVKLLYLTAQIPVFTYLAAILLLLSIIDLVLHTKSKMHSGGTPTRLTGLVGLITLGISIPWLLWGSLGSLMDVVSVMIFGLSFGFFIIRYLKIGYLEFTQHSKNYGSALDYFFDGFVTSLFLIILVSGMAQNGSQILLSLTIPVSGMILVVLSLAGVNHMGEARFQVFLVSSLTLVMPLLFFDTDELSLLIGSAQGEILSWANKAGINAFGFLLASSLLMFFLSRLITSMTLPRFWDTLVGGICFVSLPLIYFLSGTPGFYGDRIFVIFSEQVDVTSLNDVQPLFDRKYKIYHQLTLTATTTQQEVRKFLDWWKIEYTPYYLVNAIEVNGGPLVKMRLSALPEVDRILDSPRLRPLPKTIKVKKGDVYTPPEGTLWNLEMIRALEVHEKLGIKGKGIVIGQADSGVEGNHSELLTAYRGYKTSNDYNWLDPWNNTNSPVDTSGHGTGTLSIEIGTTRGIAPEAQWIGCVNLERNLGNPALYLDCMQFLFAPYPQEGNPFEDGDVSLGADIINNSWGCPKVEGCDDDVFQPAVNNLKAAGVFMSAAAGNTGFYGCSTVTDPPAIYQEVLTAGSVDKVGQISSFSSIGPVNLPGRSYQKPDLLAPGEQILMAAPGGTYTFASGTSFSAPHVTGVVALMWSANPNLIGDIDTTTRILLMTVQPFNGVEPECGSGNPGSGAGILDAYAAVEASIELK